MAEVKVISYEGRITFANNDEDYPINDMKRQVFEDGSSRMRVEFNAPYGQYDVLFHCNKDGIWSGQVRYKYVDKKKDTLPGFGFTKDIIFEESKDKTLKVTFIWIEGGDEYEAEINAKVTKEITVDESEVL